MSPDGGKTFTPLTHFLGDVDQPTLTTGPGPNGQASLWITFDKGNRVVVAGAAVSALGRVDDFGPLRALPGSSGGAFGDIVIGPDGQVAVTYQRGGAGKSKVLVNVDPARSGYQRDELSRLYRELLGRLEAIPGVRMATLSGVTPIDRAISGATPSTATTA